MFQVRVWFDSPGARDSGAMVFGVFEKRAAAEQAVMVLAARPDVKQAQIEEVIT